MSLKFTPVGSLLKMVYVAAIRSLQGQAKEIRYIMVNGQNLLEAKFSYVNMFLT